MKVFGIGLNKTGTKSLGAALKILGYKDHISCNYSLTKAWHENKTHSIIAEAQKYNNFEDWPWPLIYQELYSSFEDAKFVLTKRATDEIWYNSLCKHSLRTGPTEFRKLIYGHYMPQDFKEDHISFYNKHNQEVIEFFEEKNPKKLLVISFEKCNSWEILCNFLNKEIPEVEFPFLNRSIDK